MMLLALCAAAHVPGVHVSRAYVPRARAISLVEGGLLSTACSAVRPSIGHVITEAAGDKSAILGSACAVEVDSDVYLLTSALVNGSRLAY